MLCFWCMYLKVHHPVAFYKATLTKNGDDKARLVKRERLMRDSIKHGVNIRPPDFAMSGANWSANTMENTVHAGFMQVSGIGPATTTAIVETRDLLKRINGVGFESWADLINVKGIGAKTVDKVEAFAESEDPFGLELVGNILGEYRDKLGHRGEFSIVPKPTHQSHDIPTSGEHDVVWMGIVRKKEYKDYIEDQRARTGDSLEEIQAGMKDPTLVKSCVMHCYDDGDEEVYVRFNRWTFPEYREAIEGIEIDHDIIVIRGRKREDFGISLHIPPPWKANNALIVIDPTDDMEDDDG